MIKYILFFLSLSCTLFSQTNNQKNNYTAKIKIFSFNENLTELGYLDKGEFRNIDISTDNLSTEIYYSGKNEIEFVRIVKNLNEQEEDKILQKKTEILRIYLETLNKEYNELFEKLKAISEVVADNEREQTINERQEILVLNEKMAELRKKISQSEIDLAKSENIQIRKLNRVDDYRPQEKQSKKDISKENPQLKRPAQYEPVAKFSIPESGRNYILIFNKNGKGISISSLDDTPGVFPFGSYQFFNLSNKLVELRFGSKIISLNPSGRTIFKPEIQNGDYLEGEFWTKSEGEFHLGYNFRNLYVKRIRSLAFIIPTSPEGNILSLKIVEERGQVESPPAEKPKSKDKKDKESEKKENENRPFG